MIATAKVQTPAVGDFRSFGQFGPKYEITRIHADPKTGRKVCDIRVLTTGETAAIPFERVAKDPEAL